MALIREAMDFERAFVKVGGLLIAGLDAADNCGVLAASAIREVELLVEAGFTFLEAIKTVS